MASFHAKKNSLPGVEYCRLDVTDPEGWERLAQELGDRFGRVDGLVTNAGITWRARGHHLQPADLDLAMQVNVTGTLLGIQTLSPLMPTGGSIVVVGSVAAFDRSFSRGLHHQQMGVAWLAKVACLELGPRGIRVNTIHPGYIETSMTRSAAPALRAANIAEIPLGRVGTVDEVAPLALFLISDEASFISGAEIPVDGGRRPRRRQIDQRRRPGRAVTARGGRPGRADHQ